MADPIYVKKKLVTVRCANPFSYRKIPFVGICNKVVLEVEAINYALTRKAKVVEHLRNGSVVPLGFDNYNTYNGPTLIDEDTKVFEYFEPEIEIIDGFGNRTVVNKQKKETAQVVKHIDLEAEREKRKLEEEKAKVIEEQKLKQAALERKAIEMKAMKERDQRLRDEAAARILAEVKASRENAESSNTNSKESYSYDFPGTLSTPESDFTNSDRQENKKVSYDSKKDKKK